MIADLRADSQRWRQEQRSTGTRGSHSPVISVKSGCTVPDPCLGPYEGSSTYNQSSAGRVQRREADSPSLETTYQGMPSGRERAPADRRAPQQVDPTQIDSPSVPQPDRRGYGQPTRGGYPQDPRGFAPAQDSRNYPQDTMMQDTYGRPPVTSSYSSDPRYASAYPQQGNDAAMSGFGRQPPPSGNYYSTPASSSYDAMPAMLGRPQDPSQYASAQYAQLPQSRGQEHYRDQRDQRPDPRDPRYAGRGYDPREPSDAYPSPAATVSSMTARDREPITSPPNPRFAYIRPPSS